MPKAKAAPKTQAEQNRTAYKNGTKLEYDVLTFLRANGYLCTRSPGSKGPYDVVAIKAGEVLLIQCKRSSPYLEPAARDAMLALARQYRATPLSAYYFKEGRAARTVRFLEVELRANPATWRHWTPDHALDEVRP